MEKNNDNSAYHTPRVNSKKKSCLIPQTPQMKKKSNQSIVRDLCCIAKLRRVRSKQLKDAVHSFRMKYGSLRSVSVRLGLSWGEFQGIYYPRTVVKAEYIRKIDEETKKDIQNFYLDSGITMSLPEANHANTLFLNRSLKEAWQLYNSRSKTRKVSLSTFSRLKPKMVKVQGKIPIASSLCDSCTNFKLQAQALSANGMKGIVCGGREAVKRTVCRYEHLLNNSDPTKRVIGNFGFRDCIFRECTKCGVFLLRNQIREANKEADYNKCVKWHQWKNMKKVMKGTEVNRVEKVQETGKLGTLLDKFLNSVENLSSHLFQCQWQYDQIVKLKANLQEGHLLCSHDFAKNITCYSQREVQAGFYDHTLVSLHPSVCFHRCENQTCNKLVRHEIIHLSPILNHNAAAFKVFHRDTVKMIESATGLNFGLIVNVTDQAPSQYKNRNAFLFTSEYHKPVIHMFLGARHGKFYSDSAAGRFLQFLRRQIASERVHISCAQDVASVAEKSYATPKLNKGECQHFRISINLVQRIMKIGDRSICAVGTREFHVIRNTGIPGLIQTRNICCLCQSCLTGNGSCKNPEFWEEWSETCVARRVSVRGSHFWPLKAGNSNQSPNKFDKNTVESPMSQRQTCDILTEGRMINHCLQSENRGYGRHSSKIGGLPVYRSKTVSWSKVLKDMEALPSYDALAGYCSNLLMPHLPSEFKGKYAASQVDKITVKFVGTFPQGFFPLKVGKDGNCFPRALSKIVFNTETQHEQIRVRLLKEAIENKDMYLNNAHLRIGCDQLANVDLVRHNCEYSEQYNSSMTLDDTTVHQIYKREWFEYRLLGSFSGAWQFSCGATVLGTIIKSHYPSTIIQSIHDDLNRPFYPVRSSGDRLMKTCHVQWTKSNEKSIRLEHFVPLMEKQ